MEDNKIEETVVQEEIKEIQEPKESKPFMLKINKKIAMITVGVLVLFGLGFYFKGLLIAATVNGSPISRLAVIKESEKQSGQQALEALISKKIVEAELNNSDVSVSSEEIDEEIKKIEAQLALQGGTLLQALTMQGMTEAELREQIVVQKKLEKLLADKVQVSDADIDEYIKDNKVVQPKDVKKEDFRSQISEELKQQKFSEEAQAWITDLTAKAKIKYFVEYQ